MVHTISMDEKASHVAELDFSSLMSGSALHVHLLVFVFYLIEIFFQRQC